MEKACMNDFDVQLFLEFCDDSTDIIVNCLDTIFDNNKKIPPDITTIRFNNYQNEACEFLYKDTYSFLVSTPAQIIPMSYGNSMWYAFNNSENFTACSNGEEYIYNGLFTEERFFQESLIYNHQDLKGITLYSSIIYKMKQRDYAINFRLNFLELKHVVPLMTNKKYGAL